MVRGSPAKCGSVSNSGGGGIDAIGIEIAAARSPWPAARPSARRSVACCDSRRSTSCVMRSSACRSRMPSEISHSGKRTMWIAARFGCRARLWSCTAFRRRRASANTDGCSGRAPAPGVRSRRQCSTACAMVAYESMKSVPSQSKTLQIGKSGDQLRNVAAGGLLLDRHGDRVAVVFDQIDDRQALQAGDVERFPELAFAGGAFAGGDQRDRVGCRIDPPRGVRAAHRLQELRAGGRGAADDVQPRRAPMRGHLASAGSGIGCGAHGSAAAFPRR